MCSERWIPQRRLALTEIYDNNNNNNNNNNNSNTKNDKIKSERKKF